MSLGTNDDAPIRPEYWLTRALDALGRMEACDCLAPGVGKMTLKLLCGLESRGIPPGEMATVEHRTDENACAIRLRWASERGAILTVVVVGDGKFYYRLHDPDFMDTGRMVVDRHHIDTFRWLMRKVFPSINSVKVEERKSWWA